MERYKENSLTNENIFILLMLEIQQRNNELEMWVEF